MRGDIFTTAALYYAIERIAELEKVEAQRDELLTALKFLVEFVSTPGQASIDISQIEAAIAKAEKGQ